MASRLEACALAYLAIGLAPIPVAGKRPVGSAWTSYCADELGAYGPTGEHDPTRIEITPALIASHDWFGGWGVSARQIGISAGTASGNLVILDVETPDAWLAIVNQLDGDEVAEQLMRSPVARTPGGGVHVYVFLSDEQAVPGSQKFAMRRAETGTLKTLIETRGEGGQCVAPLDCVTLAREDWAGHVGLRYWELAPSADRLVWSSDLWLRLEQACRSLNEVPGDEWDGKAPKAAHLALGGVVGGESIFDRFNADPTQQQRALDQLLGAGWSVAGSRGGGCYLRRPGKTTGEHSATYGVCRRKDGAPLLYVFSSNASGWEPGRTYAPFDIVLACCYGGSVSAMVRDVRGQYTPTTYLADLSTFTLGGTTAESPPVGSAVPPERPMGILSLTDLIATYPRLRDWQIEGMLRQGETMNLVAPPKSRKTWMLHGLALAMGSGTDWLGMRTRRGRVLLVDNELHGETISHRIQQLSASMAGNDQLLPDWGESVHVLSLRGQLDRGDLPGLAKILAEARQAADSVPYAMVVIDALYRSLPPGVDENDNSGIARVYNTLDQISKMCGASMVCVHHTSKGSQAGKSITDMGSGAGSQSRAADTHAAIVDRRVEETDPHDWRLERTMRSFSPADSLPLMFDGTQWRVGLMPAGAITGSRPMPNAEAMRAILEALGGAPGGMGAGALKALCGGSKDAHLVARHALEGTGEIIRLSSGGYRLRGGE